MGCFASLDLSPVAAGAHLSYYWTMNEAADANKIDSTSGHVWNTVAGTLSPPGKFVNGVQLDCVFVGLAPFFHGMNTFNDTGFAFNAATSKGVSMCFWFNNTVAQGLPLSFFEVFIECHDAGFVMDSSLVITFVNNDLGIIHNDFTHSIQTTADAVFTPVIGTWHLIAGTLDLVAKTLNIYIDGVLVATVSDTSAFNTAPMGDLQMRMDFGVAGNPFTIVVDEFLLTLKGALSQSQITSLYNSGTGVTWPAVGGIVQFP